jgi:hypothetical protein
MLDADHLLSIFPECPAGTFYATDGACSTVPGGALLEGASCNDTRECAHGLDCRASTCVPFISCAQSSCRMGEACVADACVASDGSLGAPCDTARYICAPSLACHINTWTCGPLLGPGESVFDPLVAGDCASGCALPSTSSGPAVCAAPP